MNDELGSPWDPFEIWENFILEVLRKQKCFHKPWQNYNFSFRHNLKNSSLENITNNADVSNGSRVNKANVFTIEAYSPLSVVLIINIFHKLNYLLIWFCLQNSESIVEYLPVHPVLVQHQKYTEERKKENNFNFRVSILQILIFCSFKLNIQNYMLGLLSMWSLNCILNLTVNWNRVGLDFVTIQNRILKLNF